MSLEVPHKISAPKRLGQEALEFEASLGHIHSETISSKPNDPKGQLIKSLG